MTRDELIKLGKKIVDSQGTEAEINIMIKLFDKNVPYPNGSNLFYYPEIIMLAHMTFLIIILQLKKSLTNV